MEFKLPMSFSTAVLRFSTLLSAGQGHLETRSDGGDCNVDTTEAAGTGGLESTNLNCDLVTKLGSHQTYMSRSNHLPED